ncbi:MAG: RagB/SusD family nutrient uptake outer membrane protein, partial [Bacteroidales bacterium]
MKRFRIHTWIATFLILFSSCEDNFDPNIYGSLVPGSFPSTEAEYEAYALACYIPFTTTWTYYIGNGARQHSFYIPEGGVLRMFDAPSDLMAPWDLGYNEWMNYSRSDFKQAYYYPRTWVDAFNLNHMPKLAQITRFTEIVGTLEKADPKILSEAKRQQLLGEVRLCRGLMLYYMMHIYGPLPAVLNPEDVYNDAVLNNLARPELSVMVERIKADFEFAIQNLPEKLDAKGRYTADYARFCLMKHMLNEGYHMDGYYTRCKELYAELKESNRYALFDKGENPYVDMYKSVNDFNSEIIMALSCDPTADGSDNSGNFFPFSMLATPNDASRYDGTGNPTPFFYQGKGWDHYFNVSPQLYDRYESGDKRRDVILTEYWVDNGTPVSTTKRTRSDLDVRWNGFIIYKYPIETNTSFQGNDFPLARWADVLLMFAELDVRMSNGAPSQEAVAAASQVRSRAGLGAIPQEHLVSKEAFLDYLLEERAKEFIYEGMRKIDLIRFNKYAQACKKSKKVLPTHQYLPLPNYFVEQAKSYGQDIL